MARTTAHDGGQWASFGDHAPEVKVKVKVPQGIVVVKNDLSSALQALIQRGVDPVLHYSSGNTRGQPRWCCHSEDDPSHYARGDTAYLATFELLTFVRELRGEIPPS